MRSSFERNISSRCTGGCLLVGFTLRKPASVNWKSFFHLVKYFMAWSLARCGKSLWFRFNSHQSFHSAISPDYRFTFFVIRRAIEIQFNHLRVIRIQVYFKLYPILFFVNILVNFYFIRDIVLYNKKYFSCPYVLFFSIIFLVFSFNCFMRLKMFCWILMWKQVIK